MAELSESEPHVADLCGGIRLSSGLHGDEGQHLVRKRSIAREEADAAVNAVNAVARGDGEGGGEARTKKPLQLSPERRWPLLRGLAEA